MISSCGRRDERGDLPRFRGARSAGACFRVSARGEDRGFCPFRGAGATRAKGGSVPVSYTHLDVYKRQASSRWRKRALPAQAASGRAFPLSWRTSIISRRSTTGTAMRRGTRCCAWWRSAFWTASGAVSYTHVAPCRGRSPVGGMGFMFLEGYPVGRPRALSGGGAFSALKPPADDGGTSSACLLYTSRCV